jgi:hypothetical protein
VVAAFDGEEVAAVAVVVVEERAPASVSKPLLRSYPQIRDTS